MYFTTNDEYVICFTYFAFQTSGRLFYCRPTLIGGQHRISSIKAEVILFKYVFSCELYVDVDTSLRHAAMADRCNLAQLFKQFRHNCETFCMWNISIICGNNDTKYEISQPATYCEVSIYLDITNHIQII